jgi:hypothetical protein
MAQVSTETEVRDLIDTLNSTRLKDKEIFLENALIAEEKIQSNLPEYWVETFRKLPHHSGANVTHFIGDKSIEPSICGILVRLFYGEAPFKNQIILPRKIVVDWERYVNALPLINLYPELKYMSKLRGSDVLYDISKDLRKAFLPFGIRPIINPDIDHLKITFLKPK